MQPEHAHHPQKQRRGSGPALARPRRPLWKLYWIGLGPFSRAALGTGGCMRVRWAFLALATLAQAAASMLRLGIPALMPLIRAEFGLDRTQVGLISSVLNGGAATAGIPAGHVVDRIGERLVMGYGAIAAGVVIFGMLGAGSFGLLLVVSLF